jgi:hypothetical protein
MTEETHSRRIKEIKEMKMEGSLHAPADLSSRKEFAVPIKQETAFGTW